MQYIYHIEVCLISFLTKGTTEFNIQSWIFLRKRTLLIVTHGKQAYNVIVPDHSIYNAWVVIPSCLSCHLALSRPPPAPCTILEKYQPSFTPATPFLFPYALHTCLHLVIGRKPFLTDPGQIAMLTCSWHAHFSFLARQLRCTYSSEIIWLTSVFLLRQEGPWWKEQCLIWPPVVSSRQEYRVGIENYMLNNWMNKPLWHKVPFSTCHNLWVACSICLAGALPLRPSQSTRLGGQV